MAAERPAPRRFGIRIEPRPSERVTTPWDRASIDGITAHFQPVFEQIRPLAVYLRLGEDLETEHEDLSLLTSSRRRRKLPSLDVLHMVTFVQAADELTAGERLFEAEHKWARSAAKPGQRLDVHPYPMPFPTTFGDIDTLEKARAHFGITPEDHEQIYPPITSETPKA